MKIFMSVFIALLIGLSPVCRAQNNDISEEVRENIKFRVGNGVNAGIVVGVITSDGTTFYSYGKKSMKTNELVDENSVFEIGSISKTFTAILLADMVVKGELTLDDPLQQLLPNGITAPTRNGESIKLYHMANHTSSLPSLPDNLTPSRVNPFGDYSEEKLYAFIDGYELTRDIGSEYEYSNYALGLLGHVLAEKSRMSYEEKMVEVIAKPLKLENTSTLLTPKVKEYLAMGHSNGVEVESWDFTTLAGAGAIRSNAVDMTNYLAANMGLNKSVLYPAMKLSHKNSRSEGSTPIVGLAWHTRLHDESKIVWHDGGTAGYATFVGFIKDGEKGVVVLSNSDASVTDIGIHLLHPASALDEPKIPVGSKLRILIENEGIETATRAYWELREEQTDEYVFGENQLNALGYSYLREEENKKAISVFKLYTEAYPNSSQAYDSYGEALMNNNENDLAIANYKKSVELNPGNTNGIEMLEKLGVDTESLTKEVTVEDAILESYLGSYELPRFVLTVTKDGKQMKVQPTGLDQVEIFPRSESVFYIKAFEAQITFNRNDDGKVESMTLLQGGRESTGLKLEEK